MKRNQATNNITNKYFRIFFQFHFLLIALSCLGYLLLIDISSTIRALQLKIMPKYKQVWPWHTDIFALCFWLSRNYMKICFINISSTKLKWKECTRRIKHECFLVLWFRLKLDFILKFPWLIFLVGVFRQLLPSASFLSKSQYCNVTNFCIISNLFHNKYNNENFSKRNKKPVSQKNQFPCETSFPVKEVSLQNQYSMQ